MMSRKDYNDFIGRMIQHYVTAPKDFLQAVKPFRASIEMIESLAFHNQASPRVIETERALAAALGEPKKRAPGRPSKLSLEKPKKRGRPPKIKA
jgi:hypothetical protein